MPGVEAELDLGVDAANAAVDAIDGALAGVIDNFQSGMQAALDALTEIASTPIDVPVEADTTAAEAAVASVDDAVPAVDIPVEADTAEAEQSLDNLAGSGSDAAGGLRDTSEAAVFAQGALTSAGGSAAGLGAALGKFRGAGAAAAILGVGAAAGVLFTQALDSQAATERWRATLGSLASDVDRIDVGSLDRDLSDLALTLGTDDDALRQAAASFFVMGDAAGVARPQVADTTEQVIALAARAVALNPALGSVDQVIGRMTRGLATGGRFAATYGLSLNRAEIEARALRDTGKSSADQLEQYEKVAAGAAIATEKYGASLDEAITTGGANAQIVLARIAQTFEEIVERTGAPIVMPVLQALEALLPLVESVGGAVGSILTVGFQLLGPVLQAAAAVIDPFAAGLQVIADGLSLIPAPVWLAIAAGVALLAVHITGLTGALAANAVAFATNPVTIWIAAIVGAISVVGLLADSIGGGGESIAEAREEIQGFVGDLKELGPAAAAARFLEEEVDQAALAARAAARDNKDMATSADLVAQSYRNAGVAIDTTGTRAKTAFADARRDLRLLAEESPTQASKVVEGLRAAGTASGFTANELRQLDQVVRTGTTAFQENAVQSEAAAAGDQALADAATILQDRIASLSQTIPASLTPAAQLFGDFSAAVQQGFNGAVPSVDQFITNLQETVGETQAWLSGIQSLLLRGLPGLATLVQSQSAPIGRALLDQINAATPETVAAWNAMIESGITTIDTQSGTLTLTAQQAVEQMLGSPGFGSLPPGAAGVGTAAGTGLGQGMTGTAVPGAAGAVNAAGQAVTGGATGIFNPAYQAGVGVGAQFAEGIAGGIASRTSIITEAARQAVRAAEGAARDEAQSESPSRLFMRIGEDLAAGLNAGLADNIVPRVTLPTVSAAGRAAAGTTGGGVQVIVVRDLDAARRLLPDDPSIDSAFLGGFN